MRRRAARRRPAPGLRPLRAGAAVVLACLGSVVACSDGAAPSTPASTVSPAVTTTPAPATTASAPASTSPGSTSIGSLAVARAVWTPCGALQCATVAVPLDHDRPAGPTVAIALTRRPATGQRRGAIFVNPGGPGGSGVDFVRNGFALDPGTMAVYDLIGFDPRGVGASTAVRCALDRSAGPQPDYSPDTPAEATALETVAERFAQACGASDGPLLAHLRTEDVAADLDLLRQAVGDAQLQYLGFSFGTLIGLVYAQRFPDHVGHLVLDGVVDPEQDLPELLTGQALAFEHAFTVLDAACGATLSCPPGGASRARDELMARLERSGPVGQVGPAELDGATVLTLYDALYWPVYTQALSDALDRGDYRAIERLSDSYTAIVPFGVYAGVECTDAPRPADNAAWQAFAAGLMAKAPRFGAAVANELVTCASWPVPAGPGRGPVTAPGAGPILVIGNTNDPATPLANAKRVADHLEQGSLVVADIDGHTAYSSSPCVADLVMAYFLDQSIPAAGTRC
jgi:pimeloyl-ACP methyl ester carboxylesterase